MSGSQAQQGSPLPFDTAISVYVAHNGTWLDYATMEEEPAEIEDPVAAFEPGETVSDGIADWAAHQINLPAPPPGWTFFAPAEGEQMHLHVVVHDTQNRLCEVTVKEWGTGTVIATLTAGQGGSQAEGSVPVGSAAEYYELEARAAAGTMLFAAAARNPAVDDVIVISAESTWEPNRGVEHEPCPTTIGPDFGDPRQVDGKVVRIGAEPRMGCGPQDFENDTAQTVQRGALYEALQEVQKVRDETVEWQLDTHGLPPDALQEVTDKIEAIRQLYPPNSPHAFEAYTVLPFSHGKAHWPMMVSGGIHGLMYFPYHGAKERKLDVALEIRGQIDVGQADGKPLLTPALVAAFPLTPERKTRWQVQPPEVVGDIWGLHVQATQAPSAQPNENITAPVTFELWGDITAPDGDPGPLSGNGTATIGDAWTNPAPPMTGNPEVALEFPVDGEVVVQLGKGWKWTAVASAEDAPYGQAALAPPDPFSVPPAGTKRLTANLTVLLQLTIKTVADGQPAEAEVELERQQGTAWVPAASGTTNEVNGEQVWSEVCLTPGTYRVRARGMVGGGELV